MAQAPRRAAVAVVLRERSRDGTTEVLYIERVRAENDPWSGQMAFPGGHLEESDAGPVEAAVRETREEVGFNLETHGRLIGRLDDIHATARGKRLPLAITPVVFALAEPVELTPRPDEVADYVWISLDDLAAGAHDSSMRYRSGELEARLPCWQVGRYRIWGLTYLMTSSLLELLDVVFEIPRIPGAARAGDA